MPNMKPEKTPMPAQNPIVRSGNFEEVEYGYTHEMALEEAQRCLQCKHASLYDRMSGSSSNTQLY